MKSIRVEVDDRLYERLKGVCKYYGQMSFFIRKALRQIIKDHEIGGGIDEPESKSNESSESNEPTTKRAKTSKRTRSGSR